MFDGIRKDIVCMWFPRLASDRVTRLQAIDAPFVLSLREGNADRVYCLNAPAERLGLHRGMSVADARVFCTDLRVLPARPDQDRRFLDVLRRWALRYGPWVGYEEPDGLVLDVTGATHLWGGLGPMLDNMRTHAARARLALRLGCGATRGAAWARAHHGDHPRADLGSLPVAALRLPAETVVGLQRLGLRRIADLEGTARAPLARRFGPGLMRQLDRTLGRMAEPVAPAVDPPHFAVRLTLPEPIGLVPDVMAALSRLLTALCDRLRDRDMGARTLLLQLRRVDQASQQVELRLAAPMREAARILPLFERGLGEVDAGFGIDQLRLEAVRVEPLVLQQLDQAGDRAGSAGHGSSRLSDLLTRIGTRIGLENLHRFLPGDSHIPEQEFRIAAAAFSDPDAGWSGGHPRPISLFQPEPLTGWRTASSGPSAGTRGPAPPARFRWRRMRFHTGRATGPERIAPAWWEVSEDWQSGLRDYWRLDTREGRRLWVFFTPQNPGWFVHGEFA